VRFQIQEAQSLADVERCRALAARTHGLAPGVTPAEGWPDRWLMGIGEGRLVATVGLAGREGCVHHFCDVHSFSLAAALRAAGARDLVELRMLSVDAALRGYSFARMLGAAAYSRAFLAPTSAGVAVLQLARAPLFQAVERVLGVHTRKVGSEGRGTRARELRLLLLEDDVPEDLRELPLPWEINGPSRSPRGTTPAPRRRR